MVGILMKSSESDSGGGHPGVIAAFGLPEHAVDFLHCCHQLFGFALIDVHLAGAAELRRFPEGVVEIGEGCQVLRLEVVGPKNQEFFLGFLGFIFPFEFDVRVFGRALGKAFEVFQDARTNKHLFYIIVELVVLTVCPEVKSPEVFIYT